MWKWEKGYVTAEISKVINMKNIDAILSLKNTLNGFGNNCVFCNEVLGSK